MKQFYTVDLYEHYKVEQKEANGGKLTCILQEQMPQLGKRSYPAIVVVAGGGYCRVSERETFTLAYQYLAKGFSAFVLNYSVTPCKYPAALSELFLALDYIKSNASHLCIREDKVACLGLSAGAHLSLCGGLLPDEIAKQDLPNWCRVVRPDGLIVAYPVVCSGKYANQGSFYYLCGDDEQLTNKLSLEQYVTANSPVSYIWHTANDTSVPVQNSFALAQAYQAAGAKYELHIFEHGAHGSSTANKYTVNHKYEPISANTPSWVDMSVRWLDDNGFCIRQDD